MAAEDGLTRRIGIVAVGRAASTVSIIAVNAILASSWEQAEFGAFGAIWVLANTLVPIFLLGLPTSLLYFFPRRSNTSALVAQTFLVLAISGVALVVLLWLTGARLVDLLDIATKGGRVDLLPFLPYIFSLVVGGLIEPVLIAARRHNWQAVLALIASIALVGVAIVGNVLAWSVGEVLAAFSVVGMVRLVVGSGLVVGALGRSEGRWVDGQGFRSYLAYALPIAGSDAVGSLSRYIDRYVVLFFFTIEEYGLYHVGALEVPVSLLLAAVVSVLVPEVSRLYKAGQLQEIAELWREAITRLALVVVPLFFFLFFFAGAVVLAVFSDTYADAQWIFRIFLLALPLRIAVYNPLLVGMGKARWAMWGSIGDLGLNLALSIALSYTLKIYLPQWALVGPALATVISTYVQVVFLVGMISWHLKWRLADLLPWTYLLRLCSFSLLAALVARFAVFWEGSAWLELLGGGAVFGVVLAALLWSNGQDRQALRQILRSLGKA
jgi:O-antigen/teichoic acid export membrane protein